MKTDKNFERINRIIDQAIDTAERDQAELTSKMGKSLLSAEYAIRWLNGTYETIITGVMAQELREAFINPDFEGKMTQEEIFNVYLENLRSSFRHWYPENSTNPFSNACNNEKFNALRRWIQSLENACH